MVTTGSSAGFLLAFLSAFSPGDRIGTSKSRLPRPYRNMLVRTILAAGSSRRVRSRDTASPWRLLIRWTAQRTLIASPNNPTGAMLLPQEMTRSHYGARSVPFAWYRTKSNGLVFDKECMRQAWASRRAIVVNSFSKYFCMTGWRIGWLIVPEELLGQSNVSPRISTSPPAISQHAALAALDRPGEAERQVTIYRTNRDTLLRGLPRTLFSSFAPAGRCSSMARSPRACPTARAL